MATSPAATTNAPAWLKPGKRHRLENRTRSRWVLDAGPEGTDIIFGDKADRDVVGHRDPVHRRSPIIELSTEQIAALPEHAQKYLLVLIEKGDIERQEIG